MDYKELIDSGASTRELRDWLTQGETRPTTVRLPDNLREAVEAEAKLAGVGFSAYVRQVLLKEIEAKG